jgi:glutamate-1-semialdehyde 2,1-aminomutase
LRASTTGQKIDSTPINSAIVADYRARTVGSGALFERARKVLPSGKREVLD